LSKPVLPIAATVLAALAAGFGRPFPIFREVSGAALMPTLGMPTMGLTALVGLAAVAVFATLAPGLSRELMIFREAALFGRHAVPALATGLGSALGIIREVPAARLTALAGNVPLLFFVHRREAAVRSLGLVSISHNNTSKL
jgi:hypothetical protein